MEWLYREGIKAKHRNLMERILFIQKRFKKQIEATKARKEALISYWNHIHMELIEQQKIRQIDPKLAIAKKLHYVKDEVRDSCLSRYIEACKQKHALAFFQWRSKFSP